MKFPGTDCLKPLKCCWIGFSLSLVAVGVLPVPLWGLSSNLAIAQSPKQVKANDTPLLPSGEPLDLKLLQQQAALTVIPGDCPDETTVVTSYTICQRELTDPSLWWLQEQYADINGKLINTWLAYPGGDSSSRRIDVVVNQQVWTLLDYLDRYAFIDWFGTAARNYRYNVRVFNPEGALLAAYTCDFAAQVNDATAQAENAPTCRVFFDSFGTGGLRRTPESFMP